METKRIVTSLIMFALLFTGFAAAAGIGEGDEDVIPPQWSVPESRVGDRGTYVGYHIDGDEVTGPFPYLQFVMEPHQSILDRYGELHEVRVIRDNHASWERDHAEDPSEENDTWRFGHTMDFIHSIDHETGGLIRLELDASDVIDMFGGTSGPVVGFQDIEPVQYESQGEGAFGIMSYKGTNEVSRWEHCFLDLPAQGTTFFTNGSTGLVGECLLSKIGTNAVLGIEQEARDDFWPPQPGFVEVKGPLQFVPIGMSTDGELVLEVPSGRVAKGLRIWLDPDIPYPVQAAWPVSISNGQWQVMVLDEFERDVELDPRDPEQPGRSEPRLAPAELHGLSEEGLDVPYPPSQALADAMEISEDVAGWFDQHPDARLTGLSGRYASVSDSADTISWSFDFADERRALDFRVERRLLLNSDGVPPLIGDNLPTQATSVQSVRMDGTSSGIATILGLPMRDVPLASDALEIASRYNGGVEGFPTWDLSLDCVGQEELECHDAATYTVGAGTAVARVDPVYDETAPSAGAESNMGLDLLFFSTVDNRPLSRLYIHYEGTGTYSTSIEPKETPAHPEQSIADSPGWGVPTAAAVAGSGLIATLIAGAYVFWPSLKGAAVGLFSRVRPAQALQNPVRQELHGLIMAEPGIHFQELVRRAGIGAGATEHHLRKLVDTGHIVRKEAGGYVCYFVKDTDRRVIQGAPFVRNDTARNALREVLRSPGVSGGELAKRLAVNRGTVSHHMVRLEQAGLVEGRRVGRAIEYWATDVGRAVHESVPAP